MYLLDTDTCIHLGRGNPAVLRKLREHTRAEIHLAIPTIYELEVGVQKAATQKHRKRKALNDLINLFDIAPFGFAEAGEAARIRAELEKQGKPIGSIDYLIAGIARLHRWTVVTGNFSEFSRIKNLRTEQWHG